jgi:hypothetical protein
MQLFGHDGIIKALVVVLAALASFLCTYVFNAVGELQNKAEAHEQQIMSIMRDNQNMRADIKEDIADIKEIQSKILDRVMNARN